MYRFMPMLPKKKFYTIISNEHVVTNGIRVPGSGAPQVILFDPNTSTIGNSTLAMRTDLTLESTSDEIKAAVKKYCGFHYKLWSMVKFKRHARC